MGTQSKIGNHDLKSGRHGRFLRRLRRIDWLNRQRVNPFAVPMAREFHPPSRSEYEPHEGAKQKRKAINRTRELAGMKRL
jgi:hypothetical protein